MHCLIACVRLDTQPWKSLHTAAPWIQDEHCCVCFYVHARKNVNVRVSVSLRVFVIFSAVGL